MECTVPKKKIQKKKMLALLNNYECNCQNYELKYAFVISLFIKTYFQKTNNFTLIM